MHKVEGCYDQWVLHDILQHSLQNDYHFEVLRQITIFHYVHLQWLCMLALMPRGTISQVTMLQVGAMMEDGLFGTKELEG